MVEQTLEQDPYKPILLQSMLNGHFIDCAENELISCVTKRDRLLFLKRSRQNAPRLPESHHFWNAADLICWTAGSKYWGKKEI